MTRIASGHPAIWPDICAENRDAIVDALDGLIDGLWRRCAAVVDERRPRRPAGRARTGPRGPRQPARRGPSGRTSSSRCGCRCPTAPAPLAEVTTLAAELGVNIAHSRSPTPPRATSGVAILLVDAERSELFRGGLMARRFKPSVRRLT